MNCITFTSKFRQFNLLLVLLLVLASHQYLLPVQYRVYLPHVGKIRQPVHVAGNRVQVHEKSAEQQDGNGRNWSREYGHLNTHV